MGDRMPAPPTWRDPEMHETNLESELDFAERVHYAFLPRHHLSDVLEVQVASRPHAQIGGDYCSIMPLDDGRTLVSLCDATGHGLAAALFAARINTYVLTRAHREPSPCALTASLNAFLYEHLPSAGMHASFAAALFDAEARELIFAGAGHPPALLRRRDGSVTRLASSTVMLGIADPLPVDCAVHRVALEPGDRILLYTDGVTDRVLGDGRRAGVDAVEAWFEAHGDLEGRDLVDRLAGVGTTDEGDQADDVLVILATVRA